MCGAYALCGSSSVLFQGPHIQLIIGIQKCLSQGHGVCKFSISGNDFHRIPQAHKLFQAFSCQDHVHLLWQPAVGKESFDDRDQSWQQVLSLTTLDIKICPLAPRFLGVCEHNMLSLRFVSLVVDSWLLYSS